MDLVISLLLIPAMQKGGKSSNFGSVQLEYESHVEESVIFFTTKVVAHGNMKNEVSTIQCLATTTLSTHWVNLKSNTNLYPGVF